MTTAPRARGAVPSGPDGVGGRCRAAPRARGAVPWSRSAIARPPLVLLPAPAGLFPAAQRPVGPPGLLPAPAGLFHRRARERRDHPAAPRARGAVPQCCCVRNQAGACSPRPRGCSLGEHRVAAITSAPRARGAVPASPRRGGGLGPAPRARGAVPRHPRRWWARGATCGCSPRPRGCSPMRRWASGCPSAPRARGAVPSAAAPKIAPGPAPRARGAVPAQRCLPQVWPGPAPRARGAVPRAGPSPGAGHAAPRARGAVPGTSDLPM